MKLEQIFDFAERLFRIWVGTAWSKGAFALIIGGVASINGVLQFIIPPIAKVLGITVTVH